MFLGVFFFEILLQKIWIWVQNSGKLSFAQEQKKYGPGIDIEKKSATPSMGGVVFVSLALAALFFSQFPHIWIFAIACSLVGFIDDALKFCKHSSEGFSSLKKLFMQVIISIIYAVWVSMEEGWIAVPLIVFLSVGFQNAVNISDGLDGLASGLTVISLAAFVMISQNFSLDAAILGGIALGFLWHNSYPAKIFMGDTGSHFLAGALFALVVSQTGNISLLVAIGFFFGIEVLSSAVQIFSIRKFGKKIFKMAPIHHHFQLSGWSETTVVNRFWIIHAVGIAVLYAFFKGLSLI